MIPINIKKVMLESLLENGSLITFHWNDTFLECCDLYSQKKNERVEIEKFKAVYRRYLHELINLGYVTAGKFMGIGEGGYNQYGTRGYKNYDLIESVREKIKKIIDSLSHR